MFFLLSFYRLDSIHEFAELLLYLTLFPLSDTKVLFDFVVLYLRFRERLLPVAGLHPLKIRLILVFETL